MYFVKAFHKIYSQPSTEVPLTFDLILLSIDFFVPMKSMQSKYKVLVFLALNRNS